MKNCEKNIQDIMPFMAAGITWRKTASGEIKKCEGEDCNNCDFFSYNGSCSDEKLKWLNSEYEESKEIDWDNDIDWNRVPVDTPVLVRDGKADKREKRHFDRKEGRHYLAWVDGRTSFTSDSKIKPYSWRYCQLARLDGYGKVAGRIRNRNCHD